jgi:hypothetical protein
MRPIPHGFGAVLLVGCFVMVIPAASEHEGLMAPCGGRYANYAPTPEEIETILHDHQAWLDSERNQEDIRRANLCQANLQYAFLKEADLRLAILSGVNLRRASLDGTKLHRG